jgi:hypothetical protein
MASLRCNAMAAGMPADRLAAGQWRSVHRLGTARHGTTQHSRVLPVAASAAGAQQVGAGRGDQQPGERRAPVAGPAVPQSHLNQRAHTVSVCLHIELA